MQSDKMNDLTALLTKLSDSFEEFTDEKKADYYSSFCKIYTDDFRHSYAELSSFCDSLLPDQRDVLVQYLDEFLVYCDSKLDSLEMTKRIGKLVDHIELENLRINRMKRIELTGKKIDEEKKKYEEQMKENLEQAQSLKKRLDETSTYTVTVLGIFTGIALSIFGGMSFLSGALNNMNTFSPHRLTFFVTLIGFILFNVVSYMLALVAYLSGKPLIFNKEQRKYVNQSSFYKFAYLGVNILMLLIMVIDYVLWAFL